MNSRDRVRTTLKRQGVPDRIPFEISWGAFTPLLMKTFREKTGSTLSPEEYFDFDTRFVLPSPTRRTIDFSKYFTTLEADVSFSEWGVGSVPTRIKENYGNRLSFWGGIGVQSVMPHGTPEDVRRVVRQTVEQLGKGGGLLLAPAHILDPSVPWANIEAFIEAVRT
jgi:hypothetical protein